MPQRVSTLDLAFAALAATVATASATRAQGAAAPPPPSVEISSPMVTEGNSGMTPFEASVTLVFATLPMDVDVTAVPGTATTADYVFAPAHLTLAPGVAQKVYGFVVGDRVFEGDDTFTLQARPTSPGQFGFSGGGLVTIVDDDDDLASRVSVDSESIPEGNQGWHPVDVNVRLAPASTGTVTVDYATWAGTTAQQPAVGVLDYRDKTGTLTFAPGETAKTISVDVNGDTVWERDVAFAVKLSNPKGGLLGTASANVTLTNDDAPSEVTIDDLQVTESDAGIKDAQVTLHFAPPMPFDTKVHLNVVSGSARDGEDFIGGFQTIYPQYGATTMTFAVQIFGDTTPECDEGVLIQYAGVYTGDDTQKVAHLLILDDDGGPKDAGMCPHPFGMISAPALGDGGAKTAPLDDGSVDDESTMPMNGADAGATELPPTSTGAAGATQGPPTTTGAGGTTGAKSGNLGARGGCAIADSGASPWRVALALLATVLAARRRRRV